MMELEDSSGTWKPAAGARRTRTRVESQPEMITCVIFIKKQRDSGSSAGRPGRDWTAAAGPNGDF